MKRIPKVGDKVVALFDVFIGDHARGSIQVITEVRVDRGFISIWVSNTNDSPWALGTTWELVPLPKPKVGGKLL